MEDIVKVSSPGGRDPYDALRPWSAITHGIGIVFGLVGTVLLTLRIQSRLHLLGILVYGLSMVMLYTASTLYHSLRTGVSGRLLLRRLDHCSICLLIAGSYTPICLSVLWDSCGPALLAMVWGVAAVGLLISVFWLGAPRWVTVGVYLAMGWLVVFALKPLVAVISSSGLFWLALGGVMYSIGAVLYAVKLPGRNNPRFGCHEVFHLFILLGTMCQYVTMWQTAG